MDLTKREITKIAREVGRFTVRTLKADGIGPGEFDFIHVVRHRPGATQAEVCRVLGIDKGAAARRTARLESKGYLVRKKDPRDARSSLLYATEKAEALKNSKVSVEAAFYEWLLEPLSPAEQQDFCRLLEALYLRCRAESKADFPVMNEKIRGGVQNEK